MVAVKLESLKSAVNNELKSFLDGQDIAKLSPVVHAHLREVNLRQGKRLRPLLFLISYLGYSKKPAANYLTAAAGLEIIQSFILIHDDIVDRSDLRRGLPSLHKIIDRQIKGRTSRFDGRDAAMIEGDILFALGIKAFMSSKEDPAEESRKLSTSSSTRLCGLAAGK